MDLGQKLKFLHPNRHEPASTSMSIVEIDDDEKQREPRNGSAGLGFSAPTLSGGFDLAGATVPRDPLLPSGRLGTACLCF